MHTNWLEYYRNNYYPLLEGVSDKAATKRGLIPGLYHRADGFNLMFAYLLDRAQTSYKIIETGTLRNPGNWKDGQSARLFVEFVENTSGSVRSVDIDSEACACARAAVTSDKFSVTCSDSVQWLGSLGDLDSVDLFYLDSWDVKWDDDRDSAEHHLQEFLTIEPYLKAGSLVAIDDNSRFASSGQRTGKGRRIVEYLESKNKLPDYDAYQIIYTF